ncbi:MAG: hypothetical protein Q9M18_09170, partial [Mariprofundaceae bacterium]|nr:hypothetical protein [Mariprofundaceae bacterium]
MFNYSYVSKAWQAISVLAMLFLFSGCATKPPNMTWQKVQPACGDLIARLDINIDREHVRDVQNMRIKAFPMLRSNRFWSSYSHALNTEKKASFWLNQLEKLALTDWDIEKNNLQVSSQTQLETWAQKNFHQSVHEALHQCMQQTHAFRLQHLAEIIVASQVPDDYQMWKRTLGIYPLTALPFLMGVHHWHDEAKSNFQKPLKYGLSDLHYHLAKSLNSGDKQPLFQNEHSSKNPLHIPLPNASETTRLLNYFSPQISILLGLQADYLGEIKINAAGQIIHVKKPVVYTHISHTRWQGKALLQLNYVFWFPERPKTSSFDLLGGKLDGLIWRVTLDE